MPTAPPLPPHICINPSHTRWLADVVVGVDTANSPTLLAEKVTTDCQVATGVGLDVGEQGNPSHRASTSRMIWLELASFATTYVFATHGVLESKVGARLMLCCWAATDAGCWGAACGLK